VWLPKSDQGICGSTWWQIVPTQRPSLEESRTRASTCCHIALFGTITSWFGANWLQNSSDLCRSNMTICFGSRPMQLRAAVMLKSLMFVALIQFLIRDHQQSLFDINYSISHLEMRQ